MTSMPDSIEQLTDLECSETLTELVCALSTIEGEEHYVMEPLAYSNCSHLIFKSCLKTPREQHCKEI